jgi:hypothetical protein
MRFELLGQRAMQAGASAIQSQVEMPIGDMHSQVVSHGSAHAGSVLAFRPLKTW